MIFSGERRFYGWIALAGAILVFFLNAGIIFFSYGVFLPFICETTGWSRAEVSGGYSIFFLLIGLLAVPAGSFITRFGPRKSIILGGSTAAAGLACLSLTSEVWQLYLFFGLLVGAGCAFSHFIPTTTIVNNWFIKRRPLALSLLTTAGGVGGLVFPPLVAQLISCTSWRISWLFLAAILLVLGVGVGGFILIRDKPEDMGQKPDGKVAGERMEKESNQTEKQKVSGVMHSLPLWLIIVIFAAQGFALQTMVAHQVAYLKDLGSSSVLAATILGFLPGISIVGRLGYGFLARKFKAEHLVASFLASMLVAVLIIRCATSLPLICIYTALFGFSFGGLIVARPDLIARYYGRTAYPKLQGRVMLFRNPIVAVGPWAAGSIYSATGSYNLAFVMVCASLTLGLTSALLLGRAG